MAYHHLKRRNKSIFYLPFPNISSNRAHAFQIFSFIFLERDIENLYFFICSKHILVNNDDKIPKTQAL